MTDEVMAAPAVDDCEDRTSQDPAPVDAESDERKPQVNNIDIFLRIKPVPRPTNRIVIDPLEGSVEFNIPRDAAAGLINNSKEKYAFAFDGILTPEAKQDEVFERVARPLAVSVLDGFNATIFAYGQTGSGKTFTITGGAERYVDRGIIPRTIAAIFSETSKRSDYTYQVLISYLEIYNETGYDLLDPTREVQAMEDLPQVYIQEDEEQRLHFKNLSVHRSTSEEEALNLLFLGDTNRTVSETPMNQASTRSHCIFTMMLEARRSGSDLIRRSKLHLVDLAGSERVGKTGIAGTNLTEAKYINLSLHYLEQVIVALQEKSMGLARGYVPYRNSIMTMVLRDSLGGNCRTVMVATMSSDAAHMDESISTCKFAQRVAMIRNEVSVNEEVDPKQIIKRLKQENRELKEEIQLLKGGGPARGPLTPDEFTRLKQQLLAYVTDVGSGAMLNFGGDMMMIRASWQVFKQLLLEARQSPGAAGAAASEVAADASTVGSKADYPSAPAATGSADSNVRSLQDQVRKLQLQVKQRDNEIAIMIGMLKGRSAGAAGSSQSHAASEGAASTQQQQAGVEAGQQSGVARRSITAGGGEVLSALLDTHLLADRHKAFEVFRKSYKQGEVIEDNKQLLKAKYDQAKALGASVNASKARINELRAQIEQWRMQRSAACVAEGRDPLVELQQDDPREHRAKQQIEQEKASYKADFSQLRDLKGEIEHLQMLLEQSRQRLQKDFQQWLSLIARQQQQQQDPQQQQLQQAGEQLVTSSGSRGDGGSNSNSSSRPLSARSYSRSSSGSTAAGRDAGSLAASTSSTSSGSILQKSRSSVHSDHRSSSSGGSIQAARANSRDNLPKFSSTANTNPGLDLSKVDPAVLEAAAPHLTGNAAADEDIIKFYEARAKLLRQLGQQQ